MKRSAASIGIVMSVLSLSLPASAQVASARETNPALWKSTPDAAALGSASRGFLELGLTEEDGSWLGSGGIALKGGTLHFTYGRGDNDFRDYGLGYARRLTEQSLGRFASWGVGVDLSAAYQQARPGWLYDARALRLMAPASFRLGWPSHFSLTPYVGPYAELGSATLVDYSTDCANGLCVFHTSTARTRTNSFGLALGAQLEVWRLGLTVGAAGVPDHLRAFKPGWTSSAGLRIRF